jgi:hypothetical protein
MKLQINKEFQELIPPLSVEELASLERSIKAEGCRDPVVVWNNTIVDGHHRYAICTNNNMPFETKEVQGLDTEIDVKLWMINNQFSRRNLPTETRLDLAYRFKEFEVEKANARQLAGAKIDQIDNDDTLAHQWAKVDKEATKGKTLEVIAQKAGVSRSTAEQYDAIQRKGTKEQKEAIRNHEASIKKVYTQIQEEKRPKKSKTLSRSKNKLVPTIQENITNIYSSITNHQGLTDINYWLTHSALGNNENYLEPVYKIHHQRGLITKNLNQLSELVDDLEIFINQCKNLLLIEKRKDKQFARDYDKYYSS